MTVGVAQRGWRPKRHLATVPVLAFLCACAANDDEPCNDHIQQGDELDVRVLERNTTEATLVQPPPNNGAWTSDYSCGDEVDFVPGDVLMFRVGRSRILRHACMGNWLEFEPPGDVQVDSIRDSIVALNRNMYVYSAEVTFGGCVGLLEIGLNVQTDDLVAATPEEPAPALLLREFSQREDCGYAQGSCWDEYAVEVSER